MRHRIKVDVSARGAAVLVGAVLASLCVVVPGAQAASIPSPPAACAPVVATTTPVLDDLSFSPAAVDVTSSARSVSVTVRAHDTVAVTRVDVTIGVAPSSAHSTLTRTAGTATDGTWTGTLTVPRWVQPGTWSVTGVALEDSAGGSAWYTPSGGVATPSLTTSWDPGWSTDLAVTSVPDAKPPVVTSLRMSTRAVSTTTRTAKVTFTAVVSDGGSGVGTVDVLANLNGSYRGYAHLTRSRGAYVGTLTVPMWQGAGTRTWMLSLVAQDRMDNRTALSPVALNRRHLPFSLRVTSRGDSSRPTLRSFSFSPASTDARSGATRVGFTLRATDTLSGLVAPTVEFTAPTRNVRSQLPAVITRVTGTPTDRTFTGYVVVGQCGQSGAWSASVGLRDRVGNSTGYGSTALRARGFPAALSVQQLDSLAPYAHTPATVAPGSPLVLTFTEPVLFAGPAASTLDVRVGGVLAAGSWVCRTSTSVTVACDADGAGVLTATFTPTTPFVLGQSLHLETVATYPTPSGIYDLAGNPFTSAFDAFVTVA